MVEAFLTNSADNQLDSSGAVLFAAIQTIHAHAGGTYALKVCPIADGQRVEVPRNPRGD
jgi:hypothetical protein